jgi:hypothetical protein
MTLAFVLRSSGCAVIVIVPGMLSGPGAFPKILPDLVVG